MQSVTTSYLKLWIFSNLAWIFIICLQSFNKVIWCACIKYTLLMIWWFWQWFLCNLFRVSKSTEFAFDNHLSSIWIFSNPKFNYYNLSHKLVKGPIIKLAFSFNTLEFRTINSQNIKSSQHIATKKYFYMPQLAHFYQNLLFFLLRSIYKYCTYFFLL